MIMAKTKNKFTKTDVVIAGGGAAGCTLAILLAQSGIDVVCIDKDNPKNILDGRTTAISFGSHLILKNAGLWDDLKTNACPIKDIQILESGSPVLLEFLAKDANEEAFGWIVDNKDMRQVMYKKMLPLNDCHLIAPAKIIDYSYGNDCINTHLENGDIIQSQLVVGADGRQSFTRQWMGIETRGWDYKQLAIVCVVTHEFPHNNIAIEDFRSNGPFAILPMPDKKDGTHQSSLVWTQEIHDKNSAMIWDEDAFVAGLNERFPPSYGKIKWNGVRFSYPLNLIHAQKYSARRMVLVADSAHGIHPIAGQGLNLGLRDVDTLSNLMKDAKGDFGCDNILNRYEQLRMPDNIMMAAATDTLNKLFSNNSSSIRGIRKAGLKVIQQWPMAKKFFMNQAMGKKASG